MGFLDSILGAGDSGKKARKELASVPVPDASDLELQLQKLVQTGELRPEELERILQGPSAYEEISADPRLRSGQTDALARLQEIAGAGGLDARARLGLDDALEQQRTETRGQNEAVMANARARGIGGSDLEFLNRMIGQQGAAARGSRAALETAAIGEQRKMDALGQGAALAGTIRGQDFGEASAKASAQDAISRYNAANSQNVAQQNVQARNVAQAQNLGERQRVADTNVGLENQQRTRAANMPLQLYGLQNQRAGQVADTYAMDDAAKQDRNKLLASLVASGATAFASDERVKTDVAPLDSEAVLRDLNGYTYQYKGDPNQETQAGVMAQDMEKGPLAGYVSEDDSGVKRIDYGSMGAESGQEGSMLMGLMSDLNRRLEELEQMKGAASARPA